MCVGRVCRWVDRQVSSILNISRVFELEDADLAPCTTRCIISVRERCVGKELNIFKIKYCKSQRITTHLGGAHGSFKRFCDMQCPHYLPCTSQHSCHTHNLMNLLSPVHFPFPSPLNRDAALGGRRDSRDDRYVFHSTHVPCDNIFRQQLCPAINYFILSLASISLTHVHIII